MIKKIIMILLVLFASLTVVNSAGESLSETLLNQDPDPVEPGEYVEIRFKVVKSTSDVLKDITYELIPQYPFSFDSSDTPVKKLGNLVSTVNSDSYYLLYYKLKVADDAIEDSYTLKLIQSASNTDFEREIEFDIRVGESNMVDLVVGQLLTEPKKLIADYDEAKLSFDIVNSGDEAAEYVVATLNVPSGMEESFGYSARAVLGTIDSGSLKTAEFYVDTLESLPQGSYETSIDVVYKEDDNDGTDEFKQISIPVIIKVFGKPQYKFTDINYTKMMPGSSSEITINLKNIGSRESDSTSIQVFKDSSQPFEFDEKSAFIGNMEINENGEAKFLVDVSNDAVAQDYRLKFQVRSVVDDDILVEDETIVVKVSELESGSLFSNPIILVLMILILIAISGIIGYRKGSLKKK